MTILDDLGRTAYNAYFHSIQNGHLAGWDKLSESTRQDWRIVAAALADRLCPHSILITSRYGISRCGQCDMEDPFKKLKVAGAQQ